jgi:hypothetical protein
MNSLPQIRSLAAIRTTCKAAMTRLFPWFVLAFLFPAVATPNPRWQNAGSDKGQQEKRVKPPPDPDAARKALDLQATPPGLAGIKGIEAFEIIFRDPSFSPSGPDDKSLSVIVNPFTIRKRGRFFGSVYEYHRNDNFDARNFFDPVGEPLPEFKRNQFGASLGADLGEKLQVFGTYDGLRVNRGSTRLSYVPTPAMKTGDFSSLETNLKDPLTGLPFENNRIPESRIHPVAKRLLALYPDPNRNDASRNFVNNQPSVQNNNTVTARIDYELDKRTKLFGDYSFSKGVDHNVSSLPEFGTQRDQKRQNVSLNLNHAFSPNKVLSTRLSFHRETELELSQHAFQEGLLQSLGIEGVTTLDAMDEGYPLIDISGYASLGIGHGRNGSPNTSHRNTYQAESDFTFVKGNHRLEFGGELERNQVNDQRTWGTRRGEFGFSGYFTGDAFADFLLGIPENASRGIGSDRADLRQHSYRAFFRDNWKLNPQLTISLGLSYNLNPVPRSVHNNISFYYPLVFAPPRDGEIVVTGSDRARALGLNLEPGQAAYTDTNDWEPQIGLAFSPMGNSRLVIRSTLGINYRPLEIRQVSNYLGRNYPFYYLESVESPTQPAIDLSNPFTSAAPPELTIRAMSPFIRNSYYQRWQLSVQYELFQNWNVEAAYEGSKGNHLTRTLLANVPLPASEDQPIQPRRPNPDYGRFSILTSGAGSSGHSLELQVRKRMSGSFSLQAGFQWNRSFSDQVQGNPSNPRDLRSERAYAGFGAPMQFNANFILDLPVGRGRLLSTAWAGKLGDILAGWRISGTTTVEQGRPFNPRLSGDWNNDGVSGDRPDRLGSGILPDSARSIDQWFDTAQFVAPAADGPAATWFGNSGRNILLAPGEYKWDISFLKRMRISTDGDLLELRVQLFNAFNHTNFERPGSTLGTSTFGVISNAGNSREIEVAIKYSF